MKKIVSILLIIGFNIGLKSQTITLKKGVVLEDLIVADSIDETYALYLPTNFEVTKTWPVVFAVDLQGNHKRSLQMFKNAAESNGYILASPNNISDTLSISDNALMTKRVMNKVLSLLPINGKQIYTAGFSESGKFASVLPILINNIQGVLTVNCPLANTDVLDLKKMFHYIGVVDINNHNLNEMHANEKTLNTLRFPNQLLVYNQGNTPTMFDFINTSFEMFSLDAMAKNSITKDSSFINETYKTKINLIEDLVNRKQLIQAFDLATEFTDVYRPLVDVSPLKELQKKIRKDRVYREMKRAESGILFKESLQQEDYDYAMFEDVSSYNFNNLGWWKFQMEQLNSQKSNNPFELQMNNRLKSFVSFLADKNIEDLKDEKIADEEGLVFLWMLKTIINPQDFDAYKNVISLSSKNEDYTTSLFYLEELLKVGFTDKNALYQIENTGLLRIAPEFNALILKYLNDARYVPIEQ